MKKTVLLTQMLMDVATPSEKKKFEGLYAKNNKGSATSYALRIVKTYWDLHIQKRQQAAPTPQNDSVVPEGMLKINYGGRSWLEAKI